MRLTALRIFAVLGFLLMPVQVALQADTVQPQDGWRVIESDNSFSDLVEYLEANIKANGMELVSAEDEAADAPGKKMIGAAREDYAKRMQAAGIDKPFVFHVTDNGDGTATLSYPWPSTVFAPFFERGGDDLRALASEMDLLIGKIADETAKS